MDTTMKKFILIVLILPVWAGCSKFGFSHNKDFTYTGCATSTDTRAVEDDGFISLLTLKYEDGDLRVTRKNALLNCSFKEDGLVCDVSIEDDVIHYLVYKKESKDGIDTACLCIVEEISSLVTGLETGKEYTFYYSCSPIIKPFTFVFEKDLFLVKDTVVFN